MEIDDIAPLRKIRLRIDGSGSRPDWFLDQVSPLRFESVLDHTRTRARSHTSLEDDRRSIRVRNGARTGVPGESPLANSPHHTVIIF